MQKDKYIWFTDTHILPWKRKSFLNLILDQAPKGVIISGDISHSAPTCLDDLEYLGKRAGRKIYFVLGNHDFWFSSFAKMKSEVSFLCQKYPNLVWLSDSKIESLNDDVALIGTEGWYDANLGIQEHLKYTFDWRLIKDYQELLSMEEIINLFRQKASESAQMITQSLEAALDNHKTVYMVTHFPPWREANRDPGTILEPYWLPYNVNLTLGEALEKAMSKHKKRNLKVFCGHTHCPVQIHVSRNIECFVGKQGFTHSNLFV